MSWKPNLNVGINENFVPEFPTKISNTPAPISSPNSIQYDSNLSNKPEDYKREHQVRRDTDSLKDFSISLMDIDTVIITHLEKRLNIQIDGSGQELKVPVIYSSPERWKSIRKDGYIRDNLGKIQKPIIAFKRTTIDRNDSLITLNRYLTYPVIKKFSQKNTYDSFSVANNIQIPVKEVYNVTLPDHVIINYDFLIWTDYVEHMNMIIEAINFSTEDYWGEKNGFKFRTSIQNYSFDTELTGDVDRVVKSSFSMAVYAYLLPEHRENLQSTTEKSFTYRKLIVNAEVDSRNKPKKYKTFIQDGIEFITTDLNTINNCSDE